ncbi:MAG: ABC transporter ATPase [Bacteroidetes bacterium]|nr:ABC transporter ATPase [Bacteroidota bacterium]
MSRVWVYQSNRRLSDLEVASISNELFEFTQRWAAHGAKLTTSYDVKHNYFIILKVDEDMTAASGCSIDDSVKFIKGIEEKYHISLFDRKSIALMQNGKIQLAPLHELSSLFKSGSLTDETLIFNNSVSTETELKNNWAMPLKQSAVYRFVIG